MKRRNKEKNKIEQRSHRFLKEDYIEALKAKIEKL